MGDRGKWVPNPKAVPAAERINILGNTVKWCKRKEKRLKKKKKVKELRGGTGDVSKRLRQRARARDPSRGRWKQEKF